MSFLPISNARMTRVRRGDSRGARDAYSSSAAAAPAVLWQGDSDAMVWQEEVIDSSTNTTDILLRTRLILPAVADIRVGDEISVLQNNQENSYRVATVRQDSAAAGFWPNPIVECSTDVQ